MTVHPQYDKLERESTSTVAVESTLANVISSCLEGSATRKLGKVRPAACIVVSGPLVLARAGMRSIAVRREEKREREGKKKRKEGTSACVVVSWR